MYTDEHDLNEDVDIESYSDDSRCEWCCGEKEWCPLCGTWTSTCCIEYGTCMCS